MFTYSSLDLTTDLAKLRLSVGDTLEEYGPRPGDGTATNFSDEELQVYLDATNSWQEAAVMVLRLLSAQWASQPDSVKIGEYAEAGSRVQAFAEAADRMEKAIRDGLADQGDWVSYFDESDSGVEPPHLFGLRQWGANPKDHKLP